MGRQLAEPEPVERPEPRVAFADRVREWTEWFGLTRLVTSAVAVLIVCGGAFWLLRTPPPPSEATLPVASSASVPIATLAPPPTSMTTTSVPPSGVVSVHVAGAVVAPGVYVVPASSRVDDAVDAAGGPVPTADLDALNLASMVVDGSRIYVPEEGEDVAAPITPAAGDAAPNPVGPLDVNRATADELETLPGVGPATATAIVAERERNGPFASVADLERVPGIGPAKMLALSELVTT